MSDGDRPGPGLGGRSCGWAGPADLCLPFTAQLLSIELSSQPVATMAGICNSQLYPTPMFTLHSISPLRILQYFTLAFAALCSINLPCMDAEIKLEVDLTFSLEMLMVWVSLQYGRTQSEFKQIL